MRLKHYLDQGVWEAELARRLGVAPRSINRWIISLRCTRWSRDGPSKQGPGSSPFRIGCAVS